MSKKKGMATGGGIIIMDSEGKELVNLPAGEKGLIVNAEAHDSPLEDALRASHFGAYVLQRHDVLLHSLGSHLLNNVHQSLLRKRLPDSNSESLVVIFRGLEKDYGKQVSDRVLGLLLLLLYVGALSPKQMKSKEVIRPDILRPYRGDDPAVIMKIQQVAKDQAEKVEKEFWDGRIPRFSPRALAKIEGKRYPADERSYIKKKCQRERAALLRSLSRLSDSPIWEGIADAHKEALLNSKAISKLVERWYAKAVKYYPWVLELGLHRPLKGFVSTAMDSLAKAEKRTGVSRIPPAQRIARILNSAGILEPKSGEAFTSKHIHNLARHPKYVMSFAKPKKK